MDEFDRFIFVVISIVLFALVALEVISDKCWGFADLVTKTFGALALIDIAWSNKGGRK